MQLNIISVGNSKEKYWTEAAKEYKKRIGKFCTVQEFILKDESNNLNSEIVLKKESEKIKSILDKIKQSYVIVLAIEGKKFSSQDLTNKLEQIKTYETSKITFIIGGSLGIDESIKNKANMLLSFSDLTFPHQMFKIMLLEQIYRTFKIANNHNYHK